MALPMVMKRWGSLGPSGGDGGGGDAVGGAGYRVMELGSHALIALASKQMPDGIAGINALRPDWLGLAASGLGVLFIRGEKKGAKKAKKLARALLYGSAHALITRWVATSEIPIPFVNGGMPTPAQQRA